ncbi:MAG TPA: hypothetical protein VNQ52_12230 [Microbacteriaceae bacterium]|nr:hypothetical protein [Microbacteriaceae bacterium]
MAAKSEERSELDPRYAAVAARAVNWDALLWQMPALTIAAQAFLLFIALAGDTAPLARIVALSLSMGSLYLAAISMARQRQTSIIDAQTLENYERQAGFAKGELQYGPKWRNRRNKTEIGYPFIERLTLLKHRKKKASSGRKKRPRTAFGAWMVGFGILFAIDLALIVIAIWFPILLGQPDTPPVRPVEVLAPTPSTAPPPSP